MRGNGQAKKIGETNLRKMRHFRIGAPHLLAKFHVF